MRNRECPHMVWRSLIPLALRTCPFCTVEMSTRRSSRIAASAIDYAVVGKRRRKDTGRSATRSFVSTDDDVVTCSKNSKHATTNHNPTEQTRSSGSAPNAKCDARFGCGKYGGSSGGASSAVVVAVPDDFSLSQAACRCDVLMEFLFNLGGWYHGWEAVNR